MKKNVLTVLCVFLLFLCLHTTASANSMAAVVKPKLSFSGTTSTCTVSITDAGKQINATLQLWRGGTLIKSWSGSGMSYLHLGGTASVVSGQTYTLKVSGEINGIPFTGTTITKTCP